MTSTTNSIKQRKLSDLRVIDLQRELRSFNVSYDKKELKGVLIEKLRQALISRNLDPDNYLFDTSTDLKSISSDENNRSLDENGSNELNTSEILTMETESDQQFNPDYSEQTNSPRSSTQSEGDNEPTEQQTNRFDSRTNNNNNNNNNNDDDDDDGNIFLTIDQSTAKQEEDENNNHHNDTIERDFTEQDQTSNDNFDNNSQSNDINQTFDDNSTDQQHVLQTTNLSTDNDNLSKSENDQTKSRNINKDQCHLWVSNIAKETHASHLKDLFSKHGKVLTTKVIGSSSSRWFGYINLATPDDVEKCINALHQTELHGKKIYVDREMHEEPSPAKKRDSSRDREKKSSNTESKKRSASSSSSNDNRKKISSSDVNETTHKKSSDSNNETRPSSSRSSDRPKMPISSTHRSRSRERSDRYRSSSIDQSKKYDKPKDTAHRSHYDKNVQERKQFVQHQEEKIKEEQRRLADERERMRREYELLERERQNIERTRAALQKEKQDQAREMEKQQRRLADEAKHRHEMEDKIRDEKLQRLAQSDNKRSHRDSQRPSYHSNSTNNNNNNSNKGYDHRSSSSNNERNRDYYSESKRSYADNSNNQRDPIFRDRPNYRDSGPSSSSFGLSSSSSNNNNNNQRYMPSSSSSSNQHRLSDHFSTLSSRGRDMALPPTSSVSSAYDRSSRNATSSTTNPNAMSRRPHSRERERFDNREYLQQAQRRERSPMSSNSTLRREPIEPSHWDRSKSRDAPRYNDDTHKYLPSQYLSDSSQSSQQQGLWSAAPPSRQSSHHHSDLPGKTGSHAPIIDPYNWQRVSQQGPPQSHHASTDRSRNNIPSNQRMPILQSSQPPPLPPPPSSRGSASGQTHLYSHPGVPLNTLPTSQQHTSLTAPSLRHPTTYLTQQTSPTGLVLHPTGQTRPYEQHYVVTPSLSQRRF